VQMQADLRMLRRQIELLAQQQERLRGAMSSLAAVVLTRDEIVGGDDG